VARAAHEQLDLAKELEAYDRLAASDKKQGARAWDALIDRATNRFQIAQLKPLSAEQFAMSLMQATGYLQANEQANRTALQAKPPEQLAKCAEDEKPARLATLTEQKTYEVAKSGVAAFVSLYGSLPGSEFAATLDQALFLGNGTALEGWIKSAPGRLSERLTKTTDTDALADDLYLSVLTRHATADERRAVADFLQPRTKDRAVAVEEMIWALVSSNEFRFNH
jgi:hypothetical protein